LQQLAGGKIPHDPPPPDLDMRYVSRIRILVFENLSNPPDHGQLDAIEDQASRV
jgi:hypothetical protein